MRISEGLAELLLTRIHSYPSWMDEAECKDAKVSSFSIDPEDKKRFKELCMRCPVLEQCQEMVAGLDEEPVSGIFGGVIYGKD